jgi:hypothetical protein
MNPEAFEILMSELESSRLEVSLVPLRRFHNEGGCYRVAVSKNCQWYRRFCARHSSGRRRNNRNHDTRIRRQDTLRILRRLAAGKPSTSKYADELAKIAAQVFNEKIGEAVRAQFVPGCL